MNEEITVEFIQTHFPEIAEAIAGQERDRILGIAAAAFQAGVRIQDEPVASLLADPAATPERAQARLFEHALASEEARRAREARQGAEYLAQLRQAEANLAPHVPSPDTSATHEWAEGGDFRDLVRRAGDHAQRTRGAR